MKALKAWQPKPTMSALPMTATAGLSKCLGNVVMEVEHDKFESIIDLVKQKKNITQDTEMDVEGWKEVVKLYEDKIKEETGREFPQNPKRTAINVYRSGV